MNRTSIDYLDYTWSPVTGCLHSSAQCPTRESCWARAFARRFPGRYAPAFFPRFHEDRLHEPSRLKAPRRIGVSFMGDICGPGVERKWQEKVLEEVRACPQHIFLFLTKAAWQLALLNPWPPNAWVGMSLCRTYLPDGRPDPTVEREINFLRQVDAPVRWLSIEPLLGPCVFDSLEGIDWVVIGAQTGKAAVKPGGLWVKHLLIRLGQSNIPVWLKRNLRARIPWLPAWEELPGLKAEKERPLLPLGKIESNIENRGGK